MMNFDFFIEGKEVEDKRARIQVVVDIDKPFDGGVYMFLFE